MAAQITRRQFLLGRDQGPRIARVLESCLEPRGIACGSCRDACPDSAIRVVPLAGGIAHVLIDAGACSGCGDCIPVCPASAIALS